MCRSGRYLAVLTVAAVAMTPAPAFAESPPDLNALVIDYFVQAESAWYGEVAPALSAGRLRFGTVSPSARRLAETTARIAGEAKADTGLEATGVSTVVDSVQTAASTTDVLLCYRGDERNRTVHANP